MVFCFALLINVIFTSILLSESTKRIEGPIRTDKAHFQYDLFGGVPVLEFYREITLDGMPFLVLNRSGLFRDGEKVCVWFQTGEFELGNAVNMVLTQETEPKPGTAADKYGDLQCNFMGPLKSLWGDGGTGVAIFLIEVIEIEGDLVTVLDGGLKLYLDIGGLRDNLDFKPKHTLSNDIGD